MGGGQGGGGDADDSWAFILKTGYHTQLAVTTCKHVGMAEHGFSLEGYKKICCLIFWLISIERLNTLEMEVGGDPKSVISRCWTNEAINGDSFNFR